MSWDPLNSIFSALLLAPIAGDSAHHFAVSSLKDKTCYRDSVSLTLAVRLLKQWTPGSPASEKPKVQANQSDFSPAKRSAASQSLGTVGCKQ